MKYPSQIKRENNKERRRNMTNDLCEMYLKSNNIAEYIVNRDLKYPDVLKFFDFFVWWYIYKEKFTMIKVIAFSADFMIATVMIASSFCFRFPPLWLTICLTVFVVLMTGTCIWIFQYIAEEFGSQTMQLSNGRCNEFRSFDNCNPFEN